MYNASTVPLLQYNSMIADHMDLKCTLVFITFCAHLTPKLWHDATFVFKMSVQSGFRFIFAATFVGTENYFSRI